MGMFLIQIKTKKNETQINLPWDPTNLANWRVYKDLTTSKNTFLVEMHYIFQ